MTQETLVAVFDVAAQADAAVTALVSEGVGSGDIERHATAALTSSIHAPGRGEGFWSTLFAGETTHEQNAVYDRTVRAGGEVITVLMDDGERDADRIMTILERFGPVDVAERAASHGQAPAPTAAPRPSGQAPAAGGPSERTMQLSEERLAVGKRAVSRGATRLRRFVRTRAVEQTVTLRDERVSVTRRAATSDVAGPCAFTDEVIEMTETDEELVVSKTARVREEVVLRREVSERVETVRENLRREEVEVDRIGTSTSDAVREPGT